MTLLRDTVLGATHVVWLHRWEALAAMSLGIAWVAVLRSRR